MDQKQIDLWRLLTIPRRYPFWSWVCSCRTR